MAMKKFLHIEQVMKYAPVMDKNHIAYCMMFKLVSSFVVLYRLVTKYLFLEFDPRLDAKTLANSLITGSVADCFQQFRRLRCCKLCFYTTFGVITSNNALQIDCLITKADTTSDKRHFLPPTVLSK